MDLNIVTLTVIAIILLCLYIVKTSEPFQEAGSKTTTIEVSPCDEQEDIPGFDLDYPKAVEPKSRGYASGFDLNYNYPKGVEPESRGYAPGFDLDYYYP